MGKEYLTTKETARILGYDISHVRRLIASKKLRAIKWGNAWMIVPKDVNKLFKRGRERSRKL